VLPRVAHGGERFMRAAGQRP